MAGANYSGPYLGERCYSYLNGIVSVPLRIGFMEKEQAQIKINRTLSSLELCLALFYEGMHAFTHILACKEQEEILTLDSQSFL